MSFYRESGLILLGTRLRRISEKFFNEISSVYKHQNIEFETAWFPFIYLLHKKEVLTLTAISSELEISHSAASQMITSLQKKGWVEVTSGEEDARIKNISLSKKAKKEIENLKPIWDALSKSINSFLLIKHDKTEFKDFLDEIEANLERKMISKKAKMQLENEKFNLEIETLASNGARKKFLKFLKDGKIAYDYSESHQVNLVKCSGKINGFIAFLPEDDHIYVDFVYVNPEQRRHGFATYMINHLSDSEYFNNKYFLIKARNHQLTSVLVKSGHPFMVR